MKSKKWERMMFILKTEVLFFSYGIINNSLYFFFRREKHDGSLQHLLSFVPNNNFRSALERQLNKVVSTEVNLYYFINFQGFIHHQTFPQKYLLCKNLSSHHTDHIILTFHFHKSNNTYENIYYFAFVLDR